MKFYFDGCSYTYGSELKNPEQTRFSKLLSDKYDAVEINRASHGSSNKGILRRVLLEADISQYDLVVVNLTAPSRTEYWDVNRGWRKVNVSKFIGKVENEHTQFWRYYLTNIYTEEEGNTNERIAYESIKNLCKVHNVPLIITTIRTQKMKELHRLGHTVYSSLEFDLNLGDSKYPRYERFHPTEEGHQMIASDLAKIYESLL